MTRGKWLGIIGAISLCFLVWVVSGGIVMGQSQDVFEATMYIVVHEADLAGTQTHSPPSLPDSYKASFLYGAVSVAMQGTGRAISGDFIGYIKGVGGFVPIDDATRQRYAALGIDNFSGFDTLRQSDIICPTCSPTGSVAGLEFPGQTVFDVVPGITGSRGDILREWFSVAVDDNVVVFGTEGCLLFETGTTPSGGTTMPFRAEDTGGGIEGQHIDVYVGEGPEARAAWNQSGDNRNLIMLKTPKAPTNCDIFVTTSLSTRPPSTTNVGNALTARFTIENKSRLPIKLDKLTAGGRLDGVDDCTNYNLNNDPNNMCPDFEIVEDIILQARGHEGDSFDYEGTFNPKKPGTYDFQVFYCTARCDQPDGEWHWNLPTQADVTNSVIHQVETNESIFASADCDGNGKVNVLDLWILISSWKNKTQTCDLNGDNKVNIVDFSILLFNWTR